MKKRIFNVIMVFVLVFTLSSQNAIALTNISRDTNTISGELKTRMEELSSDNSKKVPVQIFLKDTLNYQEIEKKAMNSANITKAEILAFENDEIMTKAVADKYELYRCNRIDLISGHMKAYNKEFLNDYKLSAESVSMSLPEINLIYLTGEEIEELSKDTRVEIIDYLEIYVTETNGYSISSADQCIRTNTSRNNGYNGSGITVGVVEHGWANRNLVGTNLTNVGGPTTGTDDTEDDQHATFVSGEIDTVVPGASIRLRKSATNTTVGDLDAVESLMTVDKVHVINMSLGFDNNGAYNDASRRLDRLIRQNKVTVVVSAGNNYGEVSGYGVAPNAITVGAVDHWGDTTATSNTYTFATFSDFNEASGVVNKPDVCAPGVWLDIYSFSGWDGTSMSAPLVTAAVAQMIDRNSGLSNKPQVLKSALMASCYYNAGTDFNSRNISDEEGAGVIDGNFTYRVAKNGRRTHFNFSSSSASSQSYSIYADYSTKDFRVAIAWESESSSTNTSLTDYDLYIYKDGNYVASSSGVENYEVVVIPASVIAEFGAGYYTATVERFGSANTSSDMVGIVWEQ